MTLTPQSHLAFLETLGLNLIDQALKIADESFQIFTKEDQSPVTSVDLALNKIILEKISAQYPNDAIVSEEVPLATPIISNRVWFVDPLDGTKDFIKGTGQWGIHIGLALNHRPWAGLVVHPVAQKCYLAESGNGAYVIEKGQARRSLKLSNSHRKDLRIVVSNSHSDPTVNQFIKAENIQDVVPQGSIGLKAALILQDQGDLYFNTSGKCSLWDLCAPESLILEGGGELTYLSGESINYNANLGTKVKETFLFGTPQA
ncbi:MAG: hypothetical protein KDD61_05910, partial [Bdellovibrionales bacterium]|nr:hypothetical protein [Bdellovibrionales bacterium]